MSDANDLGEVANTGPRAPAADDPDTRPVAPVETTIPDYSTLPDTRTPPTPFGVIGVVAVKIVGLYCLIQALPIVYLLPSHIVTMWNRDGTGFVDLIVNLMHPVGYLAMGLLLINRATWFATRVLGFEEPSDDPRLRAPGRRLQAIAFSVMGVWLVVDGLADVAWVCAQAYNVSRTTNIDVIQAAVADPGMLAGVAAQLALGVWLFFGARRLASFWHRFRIRETPPPVADR